MMTPIIKICGVQTEEIAIHCVQEGVDYIGLNFSPVSKRKLSLRDSIAIKDILCARGYLDSIKIVALFYQNSMDEVRKLVNELSPDFVQWVTIDREIDRIEIKSYNIPVLTQISVAQPIDDESLSSYSHEMIILDSHKDGMGGGTGHRFDWTWIQNVKRKYFLAGGLNSKNVREAVELLNPYALDVASGVESDGSKDKKLITEFVKNARRTS